MSEDSGKWKDVPKQYPRSLVKGLFDLLLLPSWDVVRDNSVSSLSRIPINSKSVSGTCLLKREPSESLSAEVVPRYGIPSESAPM